MLDFSTRWALKPSYSLRAAATVRDQAEVRLTWANASRLVLDHQAEVAALIGSAYRGSDARLVRS